MAPGGNPGGLARPRAAGEPSKDTENGIGLFPCLLNCLLNYETMVLKKVM